MIFILLGATCKEEPIYVSNCIEIKPVTESENADNINMQHVITFRPWESEEDTSQHQTWDPSATSTDSTIGQPIVRTVVPPQEPTSHFTLHSQGIYNRLGYLILLQHATLLEEFLLQAQPNNPAMRQIVENYTASVSCVEKQRSHALTMNHDSTYIKSVHEYYNNHRLALIQHARTQLLMINRVNARTTAPTLPHVTFTPTCDRFNGIPPLSADSPNSVESNDTGYSSSPNSTSTCSSSPQKSPSTHNTSSPLSDLTVSASPALADKPKRRHCNKPLDHQAVTVLNTWYLENESNPYPTARCIRQIAKDTGLAHAQIRKWLANRRLRSSNTYKKAGRMNPLRYHTIERKRLSEEVQDKEHLQQLSNIRIETTVSNATISL